MCHIAVFSISLHRDRIAAHFRRGTVMTHLESQRLFGISIDRFRAALLDDPENHVVLTKCVRPCEVVR